MLTIADAIVLLVGSICQILQWILIIRIVFSWVGVSPHTNPNGLILVVYETSDYILRPFYRIPLRIGMLDFTPFLAFILLSIIPQLVRSLMYTLLRAL